MSFFLFPRNDKAELFRRCQAGDRNACNDLYITIKPLITKAIRMGYRHINPDTLEDVTQEVYVAIIEHIETVRGERQFEAWVRTTAIRRGLNALRADTTGVSEEPLVNDIGILNEQESRALPELGDCLENVLAKLGDEYRQVFELLFMQEGVTQETAATRLGVAVRTIRYRRTKILKTLRVCIEKKNR